MRVLNFTLVDAFGVLLGSLLFPLVMLIPGYVLGWVFDLFDFRHRLLGTRLAVGVLLSLAFSPVLFYLTSLLFSMQAAFALLAIFAIFFLFLLVREWHIFRADVRWKFFIWLGAAWMAFVTLSLVNLQWGNQLWLSIVAFDQTGRVSIVDAVTRSGVPPANPSYFTGEAVPLTYLYYFWYILCSLVDGLGVSLVDARAALNASSVWAGFGLIAAVLFYLQQRNGSAWQGMWRGVALIAVSGLDALPAAMLMLATGQVIGSVDVWNTWIVSWASSAMWVPHHVAALTVGMTAILLLHYTRRATLSNRCAYPLFAGAALASAFGLSVWVTFVFAVFWITWFTVLLLRRERDFALSVFLSAFAALLFSVPFLVGLLSSPSAGGLPISVEVRSFLQLESAAKDLPAFEHSLLMLAALPFNYLFELGFFFLAGMLWLSSRNAKAVFSNPFYLAEALLLAVTLLIGSFLRSTLGSNDLGWRSWLVGQFVLLVWGVDVWLSAPDLPSSTRRILLSFAVLGAFTSVMDAALLRTAWVRMTSVEESRRYYSARLAYEFIRDHTPEAAIIQTNPADYVDRPSGLYGSRQMVVSNRTPYETDIHADYQSLASGLIPLFSGKLTDWQTMDEVCAWHGVNVLIFDDTDPAWKTLNALTTRRAPLYANLHYIVFACGE